MSNVQAQDILPWGTQQRPAPRSEREANPGRQKQAFEQEFNAYFDQHIKPLVADLFSSHQKQASSRKLLFWVSIAIVIGMGFGIGCFGVEHSAKIAFQIVSFTGLSNFIQISALVCGVFYLFFFAKRDSVTIGRIRAIHPVILSKIFKFLDSGCTHAKDASLDEIDMEVLGLSSPKHTAFCQDEIIGTRKGISFKMMETSIYKEADKLSGIGLEGGYCKEPVSAFKGVYLLLDVPKTFTGRVEVRRDAGKMLNALTNTFSSMKRVRLEDPQFEKAFEVYSDNQTDARYLLTTTMMQCLNQLRFVLGGTSLNAHFYKGKLALLIDCPFNLFEIHARDNEQAYREEAKTVIGDLNSIFKVIDMMDLNHQSIV